MASLHPPTVGSKDTNRFLAAVHASISIVPGDNNCVCTQLSVNLCVRVSIVHRKCQRSCSEVTDKQYGGATKKMYMEASVYLCQTTELNVILTGILEAMVLKKSSI